MIPAIIEIILLLSVSCLIGVFFTYRYWKTKYGELQDQINALSDELKTVRNDLKSSQLEKAQLDSDLGATRKELKENQSDLKTVQSKNKQLETDLDHSQNDLVAANKDLSSSKAKVDQFKTKVEEVQKTLIKTKDEKDKLAKKIASERTSEDDLIKMNKLKEDTQLLNELMEAKEREIEVLSQELEKRKISYYKQIDGKRYKGITLQMADEAVSGKGDGRISQEDAQLIFDTISDGKAYTQVEKDTMRYLRDNYRWTDSADLVFRKK